MTFRSMFPMVLITLRTYIANEVRSQRRITHSTPTMEAFHLGRAVGTAFKEVEWAYDECQSAYREVMRG